MYNQDIGMEFSIEKCETIVMKSGKRERVEEIELPNKDYIRREENKHLGILRSEAPSGKRILRKKIVKNFSEVQESF